MWSSGLVVYRDAHCTSAQLSQNLASKKDTFRDMQKMQKCKNYVADFDKKFAEFCMPEYITKNLGWIPALSLIGNSGTFVFLIHKVSNNK